MKMTTFVAATVFAVLLSPIVPASAQEDAVATVGRDIVPVSDAAHFSGRFSGKTILITGGARGIGRATAMRAAREGANVMIADVLEKEGKATVQEILDVGGNAAFVLTDVRRSSDSDAMVAATVRAFGRLDAAVNAAGVMDAVPPWDPVDVGSQRAMLFAPIHEATDEYWRTTMEVNATGMFHSMRSELRQMVLQGAGGAVVNIGSIAGLTGLAGNPAYVASKHAVTGLTRNAAVDYAAYGIRVNSVNMAATKTAMTDAASKKVMELQQQRGKSAGLPNMGLAKTQSLLMYADSGHRMATPAEQASTILYLLSQDASNITGAIWATDGGWTAY